MSAKTTQSKKKLKDKCDKLYSKIIRNLGKCEKCGSQSNLQCAHVVSRKYLQTRWDLENGLCLCLKCHIYWNHKEPHEFVRWFDSKYGPNFYDELKRRANRIGKIDMESIYTNLKDIYNKLS